MTTINSLNRNLPQSNDPIGNINFLGQTVKDYTKTFKKKINEMSQSFTFMNIKLDRIDQKMDSVTHDFCLFKAYVCKDIISDEKKSAKYMNLFGHNVNIGNNNLNNEDDKNDDEVLSCPRNIVSGYFHKKSNKI